MPSNFGSIEYSISCLPVHLVTLSSNLLNSSSLNTLLKESMGFKCVCFSKPLLGLAPTVAVGDELSKDLVKTSSSFNLAYKASYSASLISGLSS